MTDTIIIDVHEAANIIGCSVDFVYILAGNGRLPGAKVGKEWRFDRDDIREFMRNQIILQTKKRIDPIIGSPRKQHSHDYGELPELPPDAIKLVPN